MRVAELMQTEVQSIPPDAVVGEVAIALAESRISALPVVDGLGQLIGVISATDILGLEEESESRKARAAVLQKTTVRDLMTPQPLTISPDAEVKEAARQMLDTDVHRLFVIADSRMVGVISTTDIMRAVAAGQL
jgi:CBS domain-containing protein